jgi:hypothetical protein
MKLAPVFAITLLIFSSCAPKALVIDEADQPAAPVVAKEKPPEIPVSEELPSFRPNDGLLDPSGLATMPTERDMKPTVGPIDPGQSTVIANPPEKEKATSE